MNMYCNCDSIDRARELFNQLLSIVDHVAYSTLMKAYLSLDQPVEILSLFDQFQSSPISPHVIVYLNTINPCNRLGLMHQVENIHRSIPSHIIEKDPSLLIALVDMHAHCLHLHEAYQLFKLLKQKNNTSLASLLHGYAINGQRQKALKIFEEFKSKFRVNEQVYKLVLYACGFTGGLVNDVRQVYRAMPDEYKTPQITAAMVDIFYFNTNIQ